MYSLRKPFGGLGTCRKRAKRSLMLSTVRPEPSESVLSRKGMRGLYYAFFAMKKTSEWTRTAVRPEPSESVLSRKGMAGLVLYIFWQ